MCYNYMYRCRYNHLLHYWILRCTGCYYCILHPVFVIVAAAHVRCLRPILYIDVYSQHKLTYMEIDIQVCG